MEQNQRKDNLCNLQAEGEIMGRKPELGNEKGEEKGRAWLNGRNFVV